MRLKYEILVGSKSSVIATLTQYESTKDPKSVKVLGMSYDGTNYHVLVRYFEK